MNVERLINDIDELFKSGDWCVDVPKFQTWPTLFNRNDIHWVNLRNNFISETTKKLGQKPTTVQAWSYVNYAGIPQDKFPLWHIHGRKRAEGECRICGVLYLTEEEQGTMFLNEGKVFHAPSTICEWYFFDPDKKHSPPLWDFNKKHNRYCIAAEAIYN
jgi:hypothetical protein